MAILLILCICEDPSVPTRVNDPDQFNISLFSHSFASMELVTFDCCVQIVSCK